MQIRVADAIHVRLRGCDKVHLPARFCSAGLLLTPAQLQKGRSMPVDFDVIDETGRVFPPEQYLHMNVSVSVDDPHILSGVYNPAGTPSAVHRVALALSHTLTRAAIPQTLATAFSSPRMSSVRRASLSRCATRTAVSSPRNPSRCVRVS